MSSEQIIEKYFRPGRLPHMWCPGCGHGVILGALVKALDSLGYDKNDIALITGIGCSSRASGYVDFNTANTLHGRALTIATGLKMAKPNMHVIVAGGDGDSTAIGGNHFIHACRRNIDITMIIMNNSIYGMTGGQYSPLTPKGSKATTAPYGTIEPTFDIPKFASAAGATFVARGTTFHTLQLIDIIKTAILHKGFSVVEAVTACPTNFGRQNKAGGPAKMMEWQRDHAVMKAVWDKMDAEKLAAAEAAGKFPIGVLYEDTTKEEYVEAYETHVIPAALARVRGGK